MTRPRSSNAYADCKPILDAAISAGGGRYILRTEREAVKWRQRAYSYRALLRREREATLGLPNASTPYDGMNLSIEGNAVLIHNLKPEGQLTTLSGEPLPIRDTPQSEPAAPTVGPLAESLSDEELLAEAERLLERSGLHIPPQGDDK